MAHGLEIEHKREFHPIRKLFWLIIILLLGGSIWIGYQYLTTGALPNFLPDRLSQLNRQVDETAVSNDDLASYTVASDKPRYVSIPSIDERESRVKPVSIDANNFVESPKNIHDSGWLEGSALPGSGYGTAVITGEGKGISKQGVFAKLSQVKNGDRVVVTNGEGQKITYSVKNKDVVPIDEYAKGGVKELVKPVETGKDNLTLVTNDGNWLPKFKQFERKLIVRAVAE